MAKKTVLEGKVIDWTFDCGHLVVWDDDVDILNDALSEFEDKMVRITIEVLDIVEEK